MNYFISIIVLIFSIFLRRLFDRKNYHKSINYYLLFIWLVILIMELFYSILITKTDLGIYSTSSVLLVSILSIITFPISLNNKKIIENKSIEITINKYFFLGIFLTFFISSIVFLLNYVQLIGIYGFRFNIINAYSSELINGIWGYFSMTGISLILMAPFVKLKHKKIIILFILFIYGINPKRLYFIMICLILIFQYIYKKGIKFNVNRMILPFLVFLIFFHYTQFYLNKSVYFTLNSGGNEILKRINSIILDPFVYVIGNISNIDLYLKLMPDNTLVLEKTFYGFYTFLNNLGYFQNPFLENPFIVTGFITTNTIAFLSYFIIDGGLIYAIIPTLFVFIFNEFCSNKNTKFSVLFFPFALSCALLSFRQNDYILIYFHLNLIIIIIGSVFATKWRVKNE